MKKFYFLLITSLTLSLGLNWQRSIAQPTDVTQLFQEAAIEHISHGFRDPDDIVIRKLNVSSDEQYALVSWNYLEIGGMTLLRQEDGTTEVLTHGGGALDRPSLEAMEIPPATAEELIPEEPAQ